MASTCTAFFSTDWPSSIRFTFSPLTVSWPVFFQDDLEGDASARVRDVADEFHVEHGDVGGLRSGLPQRMKTRLAWERISSHLALSAPCCRSKPDFCMSLKT